MAEPQLTEKELQALLRLKRYEQPAPAYFDGLLKNVHRQQQADRVAAGEEPALSESQLQTLLRLKRYEQPPPAYFDGLLNAVHRRQRDDFLRGSWWRQFRDRVASSFEALGREWSYVGTMAGVLMIGLGVIQWVLPTQKTYSPRMTPGDSSYASFLPRDEDERIMNLQSSNLKPVKIELKEKRPPIQDNLRTPTRFIIDAQPASYEATEIRF